jgi:hypothetical protein
MVDFMPGKFRIKRGRLTSEAQRARRFVQDWKKRREPQTRADERRWKKEGLFRGLEMFRVTGYGLRVEEVQRDMFSISGFITPDLFQAAVTSASPPVIFITCGVFFIVILVIALLPFDGIEGR